MSNIVERCETLLNDKKMSTVNFRKSDYVWEIGANILNELVRVFGRYDSVEFMVNEKYQSTTGWLLGIEYVIHPRNDIFRLVHKVSSYAYRDSDKVDAMRYMTTKWSTESSPYFDLLREKSKMMNWKSKLKCVIKKVIFNDPATIVFWNDGTKTVVKAENEPFDPEKGLAMAIAKKALGNKGDYYNEFKKWLPEKEIGGETKKECRNCMNNDSPVSPYDDPLHPCNHCGENSNKKKDDIKIKNCLNCKHRYLSANKTPCNDCFNRLDNKPNWEKADD